MVSRCKDVWVVFGLLTYWLIAAHILMGQGQALYFDANTWEDTATSLETPVPIPAEEDAIHEYQVWLSLTGNYQSNLHPDYAYEFDQTYNPRFWEILIEKIRQDEIGVYEDLALTKKVAPEAFYDFISQNSFAYSGKFRDEFGLSKRIDPLLNEEDFFSEKSESKSSDRAKSSVDDFEVFIDSKDLTGFEEEENDDPFETRSTSVQYLDRDWGLLAWDSPAKGYGRQDAQYKSTHNETLRKKQDEFLVKMYMEFPSIELQLLEYWNLSVPAPQFRQEIIVIEEKDPGGTLPSSGYYLDIRKGGFPWEELLRIGPKGIAEVSAQEVLNRRLFSAIAQNIRPYGSPAWGISDNLFYRSRYLLDPVQDSILQAIAYEQKLRDGNLHINPHPIQTKPQFIIFLDRVNSNGVIKKEDSLRFTLKQFSQTDTFIQHIVPRVMEEIFQGRLVAYNADSLDKVISPHDLADKIRQIEASITSELDFDDSFGDAPFDDPFGDDPFDDSEESTSSKKQEEFGDGDDFTEDDPFSNPFEDDPFDDSRESNSGKKQATNSTDFDFLSRIDAYNGVLVFEGKLVREAGEVSYIPQWMKITWNDPFERLPLEYLCAIDMRDLRSKRFSFQGVPLNKFVASLDYYYYPVDINGTGLRDLSQAFYLREMAISGKWDEIIWKLFR